MVYRITSAKSQFENKFLVILEQDGTAIRERATIVNGSKGYLKNLLDIWNTGLDGDLTDVLDELLKQLLAEQEKYR